MRSGRQHVSHELRPHGDSGWKGVIAKIVSGIVEVGAWSVPQPEEGAGTLFKETGEILAGEAAMLDPSPSAFRGDALT